MKSQELDKKPLNRCIPPQWIIKNFPSSLSSILKDKTLSIDKLNSNEEIIDHIKNNIPEIEPKSPIECPINKPSDILYKREKKVKLVHKFILYRYDACYDSATITNLFRFAIKANDINYINTGIIYCCFVDHRNSTVYVIPLDIDWIKSKTHVLTPGKHIDSSFPPEEVYYNFYLKDLIENSIYIKETINANGIPIY